MPGPVATAGTDGPPLGPGDRWPRPGRGSCPAREAAFVRRRELLPAGRRQFVLRLTGDAPGAGGDGRVLAHRKAGARLGVARDVGDRPGRADAGERLDGDRWPRPGRAGCHSAPATGGRDQDKPTATPPRRPVATAGDRQTAAQHRRPVSAVGAGRCRSAPGARGPGTAVGHEARGPRSDTRPGDRGRTRGPGTAVGHGARGASGRRAGPGDGGRTRGPGCIGPAHGARGCIGPAHGARGCIGPAHGARGPRSDTRPGVHRPGARGPGTAVGHEARGASARRARPGDRGRTRGPGCVGAAGGEVVGVLLRRTVRAAAKGPFGPCREAAQPLPGLSAAPGCW